MNLFEKWITGNWDNQVWIAVIAIVAIATLIYS